jgi:hypothetical protein
MIDSTQFSGQRLAFSIRDNGFYEIQAQGELLPELSRVVVQRVRAHVTAHGALSGILLDVRRNASLSIVRLSSLIDQLSYPNIPLAVVFLGEPQQQLASLLHHTLLRRECVAYFTSPSDAWAFLLTSHARKTNTALQ